MPSASSSAVTGRASADAGDLADRFADRTAVPLVWTLDLQHERARQPAELERRARAVGEALVLAQVQVDAADELAAENRVGDDQRVVVGRVARRPTTWPMRSSDCGARGRGTTLSARRCGSRSPRRPLGVRRARSSRRTPPTPAARSSA